MPFAESGGVRRPLTSAATIVLGVAVLGCGERHHVAHAVWTLFDIQRALHESRNVALGPTLRAGMPASAILTSQADGTDTLNVVPAFAEGAPAAFVTTELWIDYDQVWLEPGYVQLDSADPVHRLAYPDGSPSPLLIDVGPDSTFYSPFWQLKAALVGPQADVDHYRSTVALRQAGVPMSALDPHACPLRPQSVLGAVAGQHPIEPTWQTPLDDIPAGQAWLNGQKLGLFDFGPHVFSADASGVVEALPFFLFVGPDATGAIGPVPMALRVAGVGPLFSGRAADVGVDAATGWPQPRFGAFWRVVLAVLPAGAGPFLAAEHAGNKPAGVDLKDYEGRVALNAACFDQPDFVSSCAWLDSQARVEASLGPGSLVVTEITGTCPLVFYNKMPVKR
jgi:hypothetical protein